MDTAQRQKVERVIRDRKIAHAYYSKRSAVYRSFLDLEAKAFAERALTRRDKELIAVGISVVTDCESCMEWHIREALQAGATEAELVDAIGVAIEMGGGRATVSARFAATVLDYHRDVDATSG